MATKLDARQSVLRAALGMIGSAANDSLDTIFPKIDAELAKHFEDRNVLMTDGGIITFTGTQLQFTETLNIVLNQKISGAVPQVISLGSSNVTFSATGRMWYAVIDRTAGTATQTTDATTLPAATSANQEVFLIAKRVDAGDGTQRIYWRNGTAQNAGQSIRLGASGSGSGTGTGDDLISLLFRASFTDTFDDGPTSASSAVNATANFTDPAAYNAAKGMYQLSYDAAKTVAAATTTTNLNISAVAAFTVKVGDIAINNGEARRITAVASQSSFTTEAFTTAPALASQVTISQVVYSKDIYGTAFDGVSLATSFGAATFSEIMVDYEDTTTVGDAIFDINTAPVVGYTASPDNTTFTAVQNRPTLVTDQVNSAILPSAGTALYLRFFALKTSGTGSVNVLRYKVGMQKSTVAAGGGVINSAYAFLNGVGTPYNCTLSVVGGKSTITFGTGFTYAVGVSPGSAYGALDVYVNGQLMPRFINSTLTPDGYYTETSGRSISLDKDYSALNLSIEIIQRVAVVDSSTLNNTNISYLQENQQIGSNPFVNSISNLRSATTTTGTPAAGTFHSTIVGRAPMMDLSQDLKVSMGNERIMTQTAYQLQNEVGPNGEIVWGLPNDLLGQIRLIGGSWLRVNDANGVRIESDTANDSIEITFYGTGINMLTILGVANNIQYSVDGGALNGSTIFPTASGILNTRGYNPNQVIPVVHNLALGVHTVRIALTTAGYLAVYGIEIINAASTTSLNINPGIGYANGNKMVASAVTLSAFNSSFESGTLGTRGGRAVVYQKADGSIGKALTPVNAAQANLTAADHTNEEMYRQYYYREFSSNRSDDFSQPLSGANRAFTLEDGTTALIASTGTSGTFGGYDSLFFGASTFYCLTFVGTGLDAVFITDTSVAGTYQVLVDNTNIGNITLQAPASGQMARSYKIVSGLPYGTHTVKITSTGATPSGVGLAYFKAYQPKKPSIPTGSLELADYNIMANYVANSTPGLFTIGTGVLRKHTLREATLVGSWTVATPATSGITTYIGGDEVFSNTGGNYQEWTFWGTGFELRNYATPSSSANITVSLQNLSAGGSLLTLNSTNFPGLTTSSYGGNTFTYASGNLAENGTAVGSGTSINGLALGLYKVRFTIGSGFMEHQTLDVITPIHQARSVVPYDLQNTLPDGSCSLSDNRRFKPDKDAVVQRKNISQAFGVTQDPTTTVGSTPGVPVPDLLVTHNSLTGRIKITGVCTMINSGANANRLVPMVDGVAIQANLQESYTQGTSGMVNMFTVIVNVTPGWHHINCNWYVGGGTGTAVGARRNLIVEDLG